MSGALTQYVMPGLEAAGGAVSEYFAPGNPIGTMALGSGIGQLAGGAAGGSQGQATGGGLGGILGGLGSTSGPGGGLSGLFGGSGGSSASLPLGNALGIGAGNGVGTGSVGAGVGLAGMGGPNALPSAPPPAMANPMGGAASTDPVSGYLSAGGGGPQPQPIDPNALSASLNAPTQSSIGDSLAAPNASTGSTSSNAQPWYTSLYSNSALQGYGAVGQAYLKYLSEQDKQELAKPFQSTVIPQQLNALAGAKSSPITPPSLTV